MSLAFLFLALGADFAILHSATQSTAQAALSSRALDLANAGMEEVILNPKGLSKEPLLKSFGSGKGRRFETTFVRKSWLTPLNPASRGLGRATVTVEWDDGARQLRLERYVRSH